MVLPSLLLKGMLIGFSIALPVGPIGLLCIRHSLVRGAFYGLIAGLGAALADTCYGALAGFGMTMACDFLADYRLVVQLLGGILLCYLGISALRSNPQNIDEKSRNQSSTFKIFITTFLLTLTNPLTLLSFMGVYAALGVCMAGEQVSSIVMLVAGVFVGSIAWWVILSSSAAMIGKRFNFKSTQLFNKLTGSILLTFGLFAGIYALWI